MGNVIKREELLECEDIHSGTPEVISYRSLDISDEKERRVDKNNNKETVKINWNSDINLMKMIHDNVMSQNLIFNGPFGRRRCKHFC